MYASSRPSSKPAAPSHLPRGIDSRDNALCRGLFVARSAIDLAGEKQPGQALRLQLPRELGRLNEVVLDGVTGPQKNRILEAGQRMNEIGLDVARQAHRQTVDVNLARVDTFGLEKNLVPLLIRKTHDLVLE